MVGKATKSSIPASTSANKDLSCLRCRKKKAKCSKTRPTCTRCSRSNQPCEYPDAPPNLTDLSQKVLTLYDTLRELEGEFLVKYMQNTMDEDTETSTAIEEEQSLLIDDSTAQHHANNSLEEQPMNTEKEVVGEPACWSMSLTPNGLSIQAVTRNLSEFNEFAKHISRQIIRDFGPDYLPKLWDPDAEGYCIEEEYSDTEELDEDEYLVTVPVISTCSLFFNGDKDYTTTTTIKLEDSKDVLRTLLNGKETLVSLIQSHYPHMLSHLETRYKSIEEGDTLHHIVILMLQLKSYLPPPDKLSSNLEDPLNQIYILTAYVVSVTLLPSIPNISFPPLPTSLWRDCAEYATMLLVDLILSKGDIISTYPILLCCILLAWIDTLYYNNSKGDTMIHIGLRLLCGSNWLVEQAEWQLLIASLLYLDIYSGTFHCKQPQLRGEDISKLWKVANQINEPSKWNNQTSYREACIILESRLMYLLNKVISLFYKVDQVSSEELVRKIDVDEVFTLVKEIEVWEQDLPEWAKWNNSNEKIERDLSKHHMHMIHNIVKILLFRPFCTTTTTTTNKTQEEEEDNIEQTFTKTTFLDMSISSADRLSKCLCHLQNEKVWKIVSTNLIRDVSDRVLRMFDKDEQVVNDLKNILARLDDKLIKGKKSI